MSTYHENSVWQSVDGTWNRGFHVEVAEGYDDDGEYDSAESEYGDEFEWVSTGHSTRGEAMESIRHSGYANPGFSNGCEYRPENPQSVAEVERLDDWAAKFYEHLSEEGRVPSSPGRGPSAGPWVGPGKTRTLKAVQAERNKLLSAQVGYQLRGYANDYSHEIDRLSQRCDAMLSTASEADRRVYADTEVAAAEALLAKVEDGRYRALSLDRRYHAGNVGAAEILIDQARARAEGATRLAQVPAPTKAISPAGGQGRVKKGVPAGGQFTADERGEPSIAPLAAEPVHSPLSDPWA